MTTTEVAEFVDAAGNEDTHHVFISPGPISEDGETMPPSICIDWKVDLSIGQARAVGAELVRLADTLTPADPDALWPLTVALDAINDARGTTHTPESVAASLGIDPASMSKADTSRIAEHIGGVLMP